MILRKQTVIEYGKQGPRKTGIKEGFEVEYLFKIDLQQQQKDGEPLTISRNLETIPRLKVQLWLTMNKQNS
jgi:hypothetical protein